MTGGDVGDDEVLRRLRAKLRGAPSKRKVVKLRVGGTPITAEVAETREEVGAGLSNREVLPWGHGMVFLFKEPGTYPFWMRATVIPLSIAFLRDDGTVIDVQDMVPLDEDVHVPPEPVRVALEMSQGWFTRNGVGVGDRVVGIVDLVGRGA